MKKSQVSEAAAALARKRALSLTPQRRSEIAKFANSKRKANLALAARKLSLAHDDKPK